MRSAIRGRDAPCATEVPIRTSGQGNTICWHTSSAHAGGTRVARDVARVRAIQPIERRGDVTHRASIVWYRGA